MATKKKTEETTINIVRLEKARITIPIVGSTPLIVHRWSEKAKGMMLAKQEGKTAPKEFKDPIEQYESTRYRINDDTDGFPATGFKTAMVDASRLMDGVTMTLLKQSLFVIGQGPDQLVPIDGTPKMREDPVRIAMGTADLRYRAFYDPWRCDLEIEYLPSVLSTQSVINLVDAAGYGGIGEWRPSAPKGKSGTYGRFNFDETRIK